MTKVLKDLTAGKWLAQAQKAQADAMEEKAEKPQFEGSPYKAPALHAYKGKKGRAAGKIITVLRFEHKANPAWSKQFDATDLELLLSISEADKKAILAALKLANNK